MAWIQGQSEWDQKLGKIECVFSLYDKMRWKWDAVSLPRGLPNIYSASLIPPPLPLYLRTPTITHSTSVTPVSPYTHRRSLTIYLESVIDRVWRCTGRPRWSELRDELVGRDQSSLEMHWEAVTERVWRCTCRLWSSEIGGLLGGGRFGGRHDGSWYSIHWLTCNCGNVESWVHPPRDEKLAGSRRLSILGWCCTWCMLYSVLTHDYGMER